MKSYTDLEQSHKLAEILPLDSADMWYQYTGISIKDGSKKPIYFPMVIRDCESDEDIPCWSLAALLGVLPDGTRLLKATNISSVGDIKYHCDCPKLNIDKWFDNPVDACVAMIEKLHELKRL